MTSYLQRFDVTPAADRWLLVRGWIFEEPLPFFAEPRRQRPILVMPVLTLATRFDDRIQSLSRYGAAALLTAAGGLIEAVAGLTRALPLAPDWFGLTPHQAHFTMQMVQLEPAGRVPEPPMSRGSAEEC